MSLVFKNKINALSFNMIAVNAVRVRNPVYYKVSPVVIIIACVIDIHPSLIINRKVFPVNICGIHNRKCSDQLSGCVYLK